VKDGVNVGTGSQILNCQTYRELYACELINLLHWQSGFMREALEMSDDSILSFEFVINVVIIVSQHCKTNNNVETRRYTA